MVVSFTGEFNVGKTLISNMITEIASNNESESTQGIKILIKDDILYLDTQGHGNLITNEI